MGLLKLAFNGYPVHISYSLTYLRSSIKKKSNTCERQRGNTKLSCGNHYGLLDLKGTLI